MSVPQVTYSVVPTIGPDGTGKTTLSASLARWLYARDPSSVTPPRALQASGMNVGVFEFRTSRRLYQQVDFENMPTQRLLLASSPLAGAILCVSALDSLVPDTHESLMQAHGAGASRLVVALTKCDACDDVELVDLIEMEVREALRKYHYAEVDTPIVRVSSQGAMRGDRRWGECLAQLVAAMDGWN